MKFENLLIEDDHQIRTITINRESKLNALNSQTLQELHLALTQANQDQTIRVIILTGAGQKAFVAGADIAEFSNYHIEEGTELARKGQSEVFDLIHNSEKPVLAAINGFALGGGLELAMACQIRIASNQARLGLPEVTLGLIPGYGGTQRLTQLVGRAKAMEMILTGDMITADQALQYGLVNHVVPTEDLLTETKTIASKIASRSKSAISAAIRSVNASLDSKKDGFSIEIKEFGECFGTEDFKEGVSAFLEKRKPNF